MGGIRKRGSTHEINYRDADGARHFETINTDDPAVARAELKKREGDAARGLPVSAKMNTVKFIELAKDVVTDYEVNNRPSLKSFESRFRLHILPVLGDLKAASITTRHLRDYASGRLAEGAAAGTVNRELEAIRRVFCLAIEERRLYFKPKIPMLEENNARQGFFERTELDALRRHLPELSGDAALCGYITGWRVSEVTGLQVANVDLDAGELRLEVFTSKNDEGRVFPLSKELRGLLEKRLALIQRLRDRGIETPWLFWYETKGKNGVEIVPLKDFDKAWVTACVKAGLPTVLKPLMRAKRDVDGEPLRQPNGKLILEPCIYKRGPQKGKPILRRGAVRLFHDFRRTACRNLIRRGVPDKLAMQMVGWESREMLDRYHIVSRSDLELARKLMDGEITVAVSHQVPVANPVAIAPETVSESS